MIITAETPPYEFPVTEPVPTAAIDPKHSQHPLSCWREGDSDQLAMQPDIALVMSPTYILA